MCNIVLHEDARSNSSPVRDFIVNLDREAATSRSDNQALRQFICRLDMLKMIGILMDDEFTKLVDEGIWELKAGKVSILFFQWEKATFVLLHCFRKKTHVTPKKEIEKAKKERDEWLREHEME